MMTELTQMFNPPNNQDRKQRFDDIIYLNQVWLYSLQKCFKSLEFFYTEILYLIDVV